MTRYSTEFIEQALQKVLSRGNQSIVSVARDLNVNDHTLRYWIKMQSNQVRPTTATKERRPIDWTAAERLQALQESYALTDEQLQAWCRERGLFPHHLASWKTALCADNTVAASKTGEVKALKDENVQLKRELVRKDKALAEAAALLVLQKKFRALWEEEEK
jgi:transposase-like protein